MKLQASRPISPKNLQSQTSSQTKNRLALSRLGILHGRLNIGELLPVVVAHDKAGVLLLDQSGGKPACRHLLNE
jgi:hypothetical protein